MKKRKGGAVGNLIELAELYGVDVESNAYLARQSTRSDAGKSARELVKVGYGSG